jgi:TP901 family phage tail tape measure protein
VSQQVGIDLNLDASQYTQAAGMAMASTSALEQSLGRLSVAAGGVNRALNTAAPSKSHIAAFGGFTAAAVASQASLSGLAATQAVAGQSSSKLSATIRQMARDMPIGQRSAQQIVETVNQLGISGKGSEGHIASLSKTIGKLQGATGEFGPALAQGITQIDRAFGNQNLDPKRLSATADSLTTVSKKAGVSASGILDFANAIGPMTKQAGIGESATLGIAAAFGQIGQDGNAAATAVNKMLTDMNRSVRDGSPQMAIYSNAVGMTRQNFEALFKLNPSQALVQVTKAIGSNGAQGQRVLESLNLDGVRTQRALTAISGSGQLENLINEAVGSRGNGSTSKGAAAAFGGVADQFQKAGTAAGQVAVALGSTLLAPLGLFAKAVSSVTGHIAGLVTGGVGHSVLTTAAYGGLGLLAARAGAASAQT